MNKGLKLWRCVLTIGVALCAGALMAQEMPQTKEEAERKAEKEIKEQSKPLPEIKVLGTAEEELKQAPGVSTITAKDIEARPPVNDLSEIIRTMPGVNLTGNSASGIRGNNRQIDIRGMGPENTLILIDGKPVSSRNSIRYGWRGDRDTRGDSNWVPAEEVEKIEVIRGPAASRYGSGAAGGVVNIITKRPSDEFNGSVSLYANLPEHSDEGDTQRVDFNLSGPLAKNMSFRLYGNYNKTDADDPDINRSHALPEEQAAPPAGREGVRNKDINGRLRWDLTPEQTLDLDMGFSRQGNIYTGDRQTASTDLVQDLAEQGAETNVIYRETYALTHNGRWGFGTSRVYFQYEDTRNSRLPEGLAGGTEGVIAKTAKETSTLKDYTLNGELNLPFHTLVEQVLTIGGEWSYQDMHDPVSVTQTGTPGIPGVPETGRSPDADATIMSVFVEDNIALTSQLILTPGLRLDHHDEFGSNWSPTLNASYQITDTWVIKGGIARAYKAPNLYQSNPNYLLTSRGNGCPSWTSGQCYLVGSSDMKPETSINSELGVAWTANGWNAGVTYFHNDYQNKIVAGTDVVGTTDDGRNILQWQNSGKAIVSGWEGNLLVPLLDSLDWNTNFTYMLESKNKETGQPLSVIPEYTINTSFNWHFNDHFSMLLSAVFYGKQEPQTVTIKGDPATGHALDARGEYQIINLSAGYVFNRNFRIRTGVNNVFDKRLYREGNQMAAGANTYNEPGRSYFLTATASF